MLVICKRKKLSKKQKNSLTKSVGGDMDEHGMILLEQHDQIL